VQDTAETKKLVKRQYQRSLPSVRAPDYQRCGRRL
jgi:hypothetical protein